MTVALAEDMIVLTGLCRVEDAEPLTALLQASPEAALDLAACEGLHAAVVQAILAFQPEIRVKPADPFLARWLSPLLGPA
ncbi:MAG: hypothetical protein ACYDD1_05665 [Caulobacteraceae bacterium]